MQAEAVDRRVPLVAGVGFTVLVIAGNALQGATPSLHGEAQAVVDFYEDRPLLISLGMTSSLISVFFLAAFLTALRSLLARADGPADYLSAMAWAGGVSALATLSSGFALNALGALRGRAGGRIGPESAVVFYEGGLALTGLAATLCLSVLLAPTAVAALRYGALPRWLGWVTAVLAVVGLVTPISFLLFLLFPFWVLAVSIVMFRRDALAGSAPAASSGRSAAPPAESLP